MEREGESEAGQAAVEFVATLPLLALALLAAAQLLAAGYAHWSGGIAARAGARAALVGGDGGRAARAALPVSMRAEAEVSSAEGRIEVGAPVPRLLPGMPAIRVGSAASLGGGRG